MTNNFRITRYNFIEQFENVLEFSMKALPGKIFGIQTFSTTPQTSNVENLAPQVIRAVRKELMDLTRSPPEGLKLHLNDADVTDIQATLEGPQGTPFAGGVSLEL